MRNDYKPNAVLILDTGDFFYGLSSNSKHATKAEICFTTSLTGYQEVISDPSYANQYVVFSTPHIGNVGFNEDDNESEKPLLAGVIIGEKITNPSNHRSTKSLPVWLEEKGIPYITDVDTRSIIKLISRSTDPIRAWIVPCEGYLSSESLGSLYKEVSAGLSLKGQFLSKLAVDDRPVKISKQDVKWQEYGCLPSKQNSGKQTSVAVIDFGVKANIVRSLNSRGAQVTVYPFDTPVEQIFQNGHHGIVLSNGPGDPMAVDNETLKSVKAFLEQNCPILAICFGYQLIARALGAKVVQMPCGHHGTNHPVKDLLNGQVLITSQNHEFVLDEKTINDNIEVTHRSLFDDTLEGFRVKEREIFAYQFHPEASPGPNDAKYLFDEYLELVENYAKKIRH